MDSYLIRSITTIRSFVNDRWRHQIQSNQSEMDLELLFFVERITTVLSDPRTHLLFFFFSHSHSFPFAWQHTTTRYEQRSHCHWHEKCASIISNRAHFLLTCISFCAPRIRRNFLLIVYRLLSSTDWNKRTKLIHRSLQLTFCARLTLKQSSQRRKSVVFSSSSNDCISFDLLNINDENICSSPYCRASLWWWWWW